LKYPICSAAQFGRKAGSRAGRPILSSAISGFVLVRDAALAEGVPILSKNGAIIKMITTLGKHLTQLVFIA
jgi:hypothetical protein